MDFPLPPQDAAAVARIVAFLAGRAVPGVEELRPGAVHRRTSAAGVLEIAPDRLRAPDTAGLAALRRVVDADAPTTAIDAHLARSKVLGPLVAARPALRIPGHVDPWELAVRAVLGQQVSVAGARTIAGRLVAAYGEPLAEPDGALTHRFPTPEAVASIDPETLPMPRARGRALTELAGAVAAGLDLADRAALLAQRGIGPWTVAYVQLRAFGDRDAWMPTDLVVTKAMRALGATAQDAEAWRPYRGHALLHLWASQG